METNVTAITSQWFETKVRYDKTDDSGRVKKVTESHVVEAMSFTLAEAAITREMEHYTKGDIGITAITMAAFSEIFFSADDTDDKWYKVKVIFVLPDEKTGKEKKSCATYLVQAKSLDRAMKNTDAVLASSLAAYYIAQIAETALLDVFRSPVADGIRQAIAEN